MFCQMSINRAWWNLTRVLKSLVRSIRTLVYLGNNSVTLAKVTSVRFYSTTLFFARMYVLQYVLTVVRTIKPAGENQLRFSLLALTKIQIKSRL